MENQSHLDFLIVIYPKLLSRFGLANFLALISACLCVLLMLVSCNSMSQDSINPTRDFVTELEGSATVPVSAIETTPEENASQTRKPVITPSQTPQLTLEPGTETLGITGQLIVYDSSGIQKVSLLDHEMEYLLVKGADWVDWGAHFAQNRKNVAYWTKSENGTELWFSSLSEWQPERILALDNVEYDFATPLWGVNDRYLLFSLAVVDQSDPLENIKITRTYVIDVEAMELVQSPYWPGICSILARSPQTSQLTLWCHEIQEDNDSHEFLVLEPDEPPWITQEEPDPLIDNCLIFAVCTWSQDSKYVAFVITEDHPNSFYYTSVSNPELVQLDDKHSYYYRFPGWSPDSQFLTYSGQCVEAGECPNVMSFPDQEIMWRAKNNHNQGEFGVISVDNVIWSPDNHHIAMPILVETDSSIREQILIFNIMTQQEVSRVTNLNMGKSILDLVWIVDES